MILHWHRSRSFWLGLVGLVLLLAGWLSPWIPNIAFLYNSGPHIYSLEKTVGHVGLYRMENRLETYGWVAVGNKPGSFWYFRIATEDVTWRNSTISRIDSPGMNGVKVGCWLIVAAYSGTWIGWLVWWQHRKRRLMNAPPG